MNERYITILGLDTQDDCKIPIWQWQSRKLVTVPKLVKEASVNSKDGKTGE
jgi:hypothetical protein